MHATSIRIFQTITLIAFFMLLAGGITTAKLASIGFSFLAFLGLLALAVAKITHNTIQISTPIKHWLMICIWFWCAALLSWLINGADPQQLKTLSSPYGKLLLFPFVVFALKTAVQKRDITNALFVLVSLSSIFVALLGADSHWGFMGLVPMTYRAGFGVNPIYYGDTALCFGFINALFAIHWGHKKRYLLLLVALVGASAGFLGSGLSLSRGGWLSLPLFLVIAGYYLIKLRAFKSLLVSALILLSSIGFLAAQDNVLKQRVIQAHHEFSSFEATSQTSIGYRLKMWQHALNVISEHPITGVGPMGYEFHEKNESGQITASYFHAHNGYLQAASTLGVFGLLIYLAIYLFPLRYFACHRSDPELTTLSIIGMSVVTSFMVFDLTDVFFYRSVGLIYFLIFVGVSMLAIEQKKRYFTQK